MSPPPAELDPEPADLHLRVDPAEELDVAVGAAEGGLELPADGAMTVSRVHAVVVCERARRAAAASCSSTRHAGT